MKIFKKNDGTKATVKEKAMIIGVMAGIGILVAPATPLLGVAGALIAGESLVRITLKNNKK